VRVFTKDNYTTYVDICHTCPIVTGTSKQAEKLKIERALKIPGLARDFVTEENQGRHPIISPIELPKMKVGRGSPRNNLTQALEAIGNLRHQELNEMSSAIGMTALSANSEVERAPVNRKIDAFYRYFLPLRTNLVSLLAGNYRRCFKLALAHPHQVGRDPHQWACGQLQPAVGTVLEWIRDWFILACDGENQSVRRSGTIPFAPGQAVSLSIPLIVPPFPPPESWRAPAWLFQVSIAHVGVGPLKTKHVPAVDSDQELGAAHTRLLLKGARRVFLWELGAAIETVRNEEIAAAGAIPPESVNRHTRVPNKRKGWEQRVKLYTAIQKVLGENPRMQGMKFCAELDMRHAPPLIDWGKSGDWREGLTWKEAWRNPTLRRKIRRVRQEAMKNC
jgi:hypothetical protein